MVNLDEFIIKASMTHGGYYSYEKSVKVNEKNQITITCPKHGDFEQNLYSHMTGANCLKCNTDKRKNMFKLPLEEFIKRANIVHNSKYDYSKVEYNNTGEKIIIICPIHGEFSQFASGHLIGYGCKVCAVKKRTLTTEKFIERSKEKHGDFYDYSKVNYTDSREKVTIICPKHGEFQQTANAHMSGSNCPTCVIENKCLTKEEFIQKAIMIHGDLYDYSSVIYKSIREKVNITCETHGNFLQIPNSHLGGSGCPHCYNESRFMTQERFIEIAKSVHKDKYDYSKTKYISSNSKITVICPKHGEFQQTANAHLYSKGCYLCGRDNLKYTLDEYIEKVTAIHKGRYTYDKVIYKNIKEKITITCSVHGDFDQKASTHLRGSGCKKCWISKGELAIETFLIEKGINHYREYILPDFVNKFRFDFYIPENRLLIEFQGIQHYEPIDFYGGIDALEYIKENDRLKKIMAKNFNYKLIEVNYKTFESMSEEDFKKYLNRKLAMFGLY